MDQLGWNKRCPQAGEKEQDPVLLQGMVAQMRRVYPCKWQREDLMGYVCTGVSSCGGGKV